MGKSSSHFSTEVLFSSSDGLKQVFEEGWKIIIHTSFLAYNLFSYR